MFEFLVLETFQAGLSWECILNKREAFRKAFDNFDYLKIALYDEEKIQKLLDNKDIVIFYDNNEVYVIDGVVDYITKDDFSIKLIKGAEKNVKDSYPGIKLMGVYHTKYKKDFEQKLLTSIYKIAPNLLLISKKSPKAEYWLSKQKSKLPNGVSVVIEDFSMR
jgi:hypothetical protein